MLNPPSDDRRAEAQNIETKDLSILALTPTSAQPLEAQSLYSSLPQEQQKRSLLPETYQPNLPGLDQATVPIPPCPSCGTTQAVQVPGVGPHYAGLRCASCNRFVKWMPQPKSGGAL